MTDQSPTFSVIGTSYDIGKIGDVSRLFDSLSKQSFRNFEVVFVTERDERLKSAVERIMSELDLRGLVIHTARSVSLGAARNLGAGSSKGEYLAFLDDDVFAPSNFLELVSDTFMLNAQIAGVTGHALPSPETGLCIWLPASLHWDISCTTWFDVRNVVRVRNAWGHGMVFKRSAFERAGGFASDSGFQLGRGTMFEVGEDLDLSMKVVSRGLGVVVFNPRIILRHKVDRPRLLLSTLVKRAFWIGRTRRRVKGMFPGQGVNESVALAAFVKRREGVPFTLCPRPMTLIGSFVVLLGVAVGYLAG